MPQTGIVPHKRPLPADPISYSREELFSLQPHKCALDVKAHFRQLKCYGLLRYRGPRINNREGITLKFALFQLQLITVLIAVNTMAATLLKTYEKHRDLLTSGS